MRARDARAKFFPFDFAIDDFIYLLEIVESKIQKAERLTEEMLEFHFLEEIMYHEVSNILIELFFSS